MGALDALLGDDFIPLAPLNFFQLNIEVPYRSPTAKTKLSKKYYLPDTTHLADEEPFGSIAMAWSEQGLLFELTTDIAFNEPQYPRLEDGDSVELFIDTRDLKSAGFNTRFCHHFFFLPAAVDGIQVGEVTHFRTEDSHELCDPSDLSLTALGKRHWKFFIPSDCLFGYDPQQFDRLGFSYRLNRSGGASQHFAVTGDEYSIDQQPALWSRLRLVR